MVQIQYQLVLQEMEAVAVLGLVDQQAEQEILVVLEEEVLKLLVVQVVLEILPQLLYLKEIQVVQVMVNLVHLLLMEVEVEVLDQLVVMVHQTDKLVVQVEMVHLLQLMAQLS